MKKAIQPQLDVLIVTGIFPPDIGGPATYVPVMGSELVKRGHKVAVVTLSDALDHDVDRYTFRVQRIRRRIFKPLRFLLTVLRILQQGRSAQVLYVNGLYLEATVANWFLRKPLVQKIVGDWAWERATNKGWLRCTFEEFQTQRYPLKVEALRVLRNVFARRADRLITPSVYLAGWIRRWGVPEEKIAVIYNAVEAPAWPPSTVPLSTSTKIVTVGRLVSWKRVDHLISCLADCDDVGLVIVGDGPERVRLEELARTRNLTDRVYFAGQRNKEETFALMAACDLFVLNSTYEGFAHAVLEAMAVGLPIVTTAVGGITEVVKNNQNGLLIEPGANGALSQALLRLATSPVERQRLAAGAKHTARLFGCSVMVDKTQAILQMQAR